MDDSTGLSAWLGAPEPIRDIATLVAAWHDQEVTVTLAPVAPVDPGFGAHLRRSFLGALSPAASPAARAKLPCPWDPPCALDVFLREQGRTRGIGIPKPYVLFWTQDGSMLHVTLRVFGTACDWFPAAAEALVAGLTGILPWAGRVARQANTPQVLDRRITPGPPLPDLPERPMTLTLLTPLDDHGANPKGPQDPAARLLSRALLRIDCLARWQGLALTQDAGRALSHAAANIRATAVRLAIARNPSPNRHGEERSTSVVTGEIDLPTLSADLRHVLALTTRCHLGRHTNEGLGMIGLV